MKNVIFSVSVILTMLLAACSSNETGQMSSAASTVTSLISTGSTNALDENLVKRGKLKCSASLGTVAVEEKHITDFTQLGLSPPAPVLRMIIGESGCFDVVDPSHARVTPKYILTPNILFQNEKSGALAGGLGAYLPYVGQIAGSIRTKTAEAKTALFLTKTSSGIQIATASGTAKSSDLSLNLIPSAASPYQKNGVGKAVMASFSSAYGKLVRKMENKTGRTVLR